MISVGQKVKYFSLLIVLSTLCSMYDVSSTWKYKSYTQISSLTIRNYTSPAEVCSEIGDCLYKMCKVSQQNAQKLVTIRFVENDSCKKQNYISFDKLVIISMILSITTFIMAFVWFIASLICSFDLYHAEDGFIQPSYLVRFLTILLIVLTTANYALEFLYTIGYTKNYTLLVICQLVCISVFSSVVYSNILALTIDINRDITNFNYNKDYNDPLFLDLDSE